MPLLSSTNSWREGPELCSRRRHVGVAYLDGKLYAVGGHDGHQHLNSVECFDPRQKVWQYVQPMKTLRRGIAVGAIGGPMYAVGESQPESVCVCVSGAFPWGGNH